LIRKQQILYDRLKYENYTIYCTQGRQSTGSFIFQGTAYMLHPSFKNPYFKGKEMWLIYEPV